MLSRAEALILVKEKVSNKNLIKHMLAVETVMGALAGHFDEDVSTWELTGLLHDLDYDQTVDDPDHHTLITADILSEKGISGDIIHAIKCHNQKATPRSPMDWALWAVDPLTGFIVACALMHPSKSLKNLDLNFLKRRFKEKRFAAGASREQMSDCQKLGLDLDAFLNLSLKAMQSIDKELGL